MSNGSSNGDSFSFVHADTIVEGTVHARGRLRIDGTVRGSVTVEGTLDVAPGGRIEGGTVTAGRLRIAGTVVATVVAEGTVEIWRDGTLEGDVKAGALDVEEGATFVGRSERTGSTEATSLVREKPSDAAKTKVTARRVSIDAKKDPFDAPGMADDAF